ncbi:VanZ family protein [Methylomonas sp. SURF-2]|uniref:VanZ family protein n=1 Tax=Methylomonas subterranea TaxID=2952225 RepID=A0ABT1THE6_9GAMM|nr:VanZ family protein [Methylomonas sp. SURF-2]MCQ8104877.1 VanZ family protein [Methylomonas sp. SURF-2]
MVKFFDWLALPAYCGLIYWLSNQQSLPVPPLFEFQDKVMHFGAYFVMGIFSWRCFRHLGLSGRRLALVGFLFCSAYGISDEWHQSFVPGRSSSGWDWLADSLGAAVAVLALALCSLKPKVARPSWLNFIIGSQKT